MIRHFNKLLNLTQFKQSISVISYQQRRTYCKDNNDISIVETDKIVQSNLNKKPDNAGDDDEPYIWSLKGIYLLLSSNNNYTSSGGDDSDDISSDD